MSKPTDLVLEYGVNADKRLIEAFGPVDGEMFKKVFNGLTILNAMPKQRGGQITIALSTYGGDADIALGLYDLIKGNSRPVRVVAIGPCMSAGTLITQAAHIRAAFPSTHFLLHFGSEVANSKAERDMNEIRNKYWNKLIADRAGLDVERVSAWHHGETYFTSGEALKNSLIDEIVETL
jgi:ATP-dependent protease ClpP protease subunit